MLHDCMFFLDWPHFLTNTSTPVNLLPFVLFVVKSDHGLAIYVQCMAICVSVQYNQLEALDLIHFGFAIQTASR